MIGNPSVNRRSPVGPDRQPLGRCKPGLDCQLVAVVESLPIWGPEFGAASEDRGAKVVAFGETVWTDRTESECGIIVP